MGGTQEEARLRLTLNDELLPVDGRARTLGEASLDVGNVTVDRDAVRRVPVSHTPKPGKVVS